MQKKRDILSEKRESGMTIKKREFTPESGNVETYEEHVIFVTVTISPQMVVRIKITINDCVVSVHIRKVWRKC